MLLTEVFSTYNESNIIDKSPNKVLQIPLKLISITPASMASLTTRQNKKVSVLANMLRKNAFKPVPPIMVQKVNRRYILVRGLVRFLAYQKAGMYSIPAEIIEDSVTEDRERHILYINDKPTAYFDSKSEADTQAQIVKSKQPNTKVEVKLGMVNT